MPDNSEVELVQQSLAGDKDAYGALVRRYQNCAYAAALGVLGDLDLSADVVQEAFLRAWLDLPKLREPQRFGGWLRRIVRHMALRALRELGRVRLLAASIRDVAPVAGVDRPDECLERIEQRQRLQQAITRLSGRNREVVWLHYMDGLPYANIAGLMGISETAVQGRLQRGRAELQEELQMMENASNAARLPDDFAAEVRRLLEQVGTPGRPQRRIVENLARLGVPAVDSLCLALENVRVPVRLAAARALGAIGNMRALRPILRLLYAPGHCSVFENGSILGVPGIREALLQTIGAKGPARSTALHCLAHAKDDAKVFDAALAVFRNSDVSVHDVRAAMYALCKIRPGAALDVITEALHRTEPRLRGWAARLALDWSILPPIDACLRALGGGIDLYDRRNAGRLLLRHGAAGWQALQLAMREGSSAERDTAVLVLAAAGDPDAVTILRRQLGEGGLHRKWAKFISAALRNIERGQ